MPEFGKQSLLLLSYLHSDMKKILNEAIRQTNFRIECTYRGEKDQEAAVMSGASKAHFGQSPHNFKPALAVDITPYPTRYQDVQKQKDLIVLIKIIAIDLGIGISCGADWKVMFNGQPDYPHYELKNWKKMI